jgi:GR25 family glycosyltransferase involved in LPS biosynthesis
MSNTYKLWWGIAVPVILLLVLIIILLAVGIIPTSTPTTTTIWEDTAVVKNPFKILNLKRSLDRKKYAEDQMLEAGVSNYEFVEGVDGHALPLTEDLRKMFKGNDFGSRKGIVGCSLGHINILKKLLLDRENEYYIVFEDDVYLCSNFKQNVNSMLRQSAGYDIIFMGYTIWDEKFTEAYTPSSSTKMVVRPYNKDIFIGGMYGFYISKTAAFIIMDYINQHGAKLAIDHLIRQPAGLKIGECFPFIVESKGLFSSNVASHDHRTPKFIF